LYPENGFSFQTRFKSINSQMSIECIIAKITNLGTELLNPKNNFDEALF
jgi:hypothetical protein